MKVLWRLLKWSFIAGVFLIMLILGVNFWMVATTEERIFYTLEDIPDTRVALLLGTSKRVVGGGANKYFEERIRAAASLYETGTIEHVIVSGDNNTVYYNEPRDMANALMKQGVPKGAITLDYAGFRTFDSVVRAKEVFGQRQLIIITQDFHCYRALFIADYFEMDAVAFSADNKDPLPPMLAVREIIARAYTILDLYILKSKPKFLGEQEDLPTH